MATTTSTHPDSTGQVPTIVMDVDIRDDDLRSLPRGEGGEIWLKSPTLIRGYWEKPEATAATIVDGWLRTGDLGRISKEGYLYIEDRAKDMILRAGENVYSAQVESAIYEHPAVYEAAVFGLPNERLGEEVAAVVMVRDGMDLTLDELRQISSTAHRGLHDPDARRLHAGAAAEESCGQADEAPDARDLLFERQLNRARRVLGHVDIARARRA